MMLIAVQQSSPLVDSQLRIRPKLFKMGEPFVGTQIPPMTLYLQCSMQMLMEIARKDNLCAVATIPRYALPPEKRTTAQYCK